MGVIEQWKNFKKMYGIEIQLLHSGFRIDLMTNVDTSLKNWHRDKSQSISLDIPPINALLATENNITEAGRLAGRRQKLVANLLKLNKINDSTPGGMNDFDWRKEQSAKEMILKIGFKRVSQTNLYLNGKCLIALDKNSIFISVIDNKDYRDIFNYLANFKLS